MVRRLPVCKRAILQYRNTLGIGENYQENLLLIYSSPRIQDSKGPPMEKINGVSLGYSVHPEEQLQGAGAPHLPHLYQWAHLQQSLLLHRKGKIID